MMTGKVDITNTTSFKKIQEENKGHKLRIQYLTKKYVKAQPRVQYKEKYIAQCNRKKKACWPNCNYTKTGKMAASYAAYLTTTTKRRPFNSTGTYVPETVQEVAVQEIPKPTE